MEEKVLIKGSVSKTNVFAIILMLFGAYYLLGGVISFALTGEAPMVLIGLLGGAIAYGLSRLFVYLFNSHELVVTDKRVFGKAALGKRVDLPLDSISAVSTSWLKGIAVATSSGRINFYMIKNRDEVHKCISDLLIQRQNKQVVHTISTLETSPSNASELRNYKTLLDDGIITQEEFDAKKKQLLGL